MNWNDRKKTLELTPRNPYQRFPDGRPRVPDNILNRMRKVTTEEAWGILEQNNYKSQFESNWINLHPDRILVGRAVTCRYIPKRPDLDIIIQEEGEKNGRIGGQNSWAIDTLVKDDVIVVELFGKIIWGTFTGDNLSTAIATNTKGGGMVVDGGMRDYQRVMELPNFTGFVKGLDPTPIRDVTLLEINVPVRIGNASVIPGDVVLGSPTGVLFIPPHLSEPIVEHSESVRLHDYFGQMRIREGIYTPGQVDRKWSVDMEADFSNWRQTHGLEVLE